MIIILKPYMHLAAEAPPRHSNILNPLSTDTEEFFESNINIVKLSLHFYVRIWYTSAYKIILI